MLALSGIYKNGHITLDEKVSAKNPVKVIVTFIGDDVEVQQSSAGNHSFSFLAGQQLLNDLKGNLSDIVIEDRHKNL